MSAAASAAPAPDPGSRTGVWLVGARGSVATTAVIGAGAIRRGYVEPTGCVSATEPFAGLPLPSFGSLVFGGHDIGGPPLAKRAETLARGGVVPARLVTLLDADLTAAEAAIRPGIRPGEPGPTAAAVDAVRADLTAFRRTHRLERVVVVNVASTEPAAAPHPAHASWPALREALAAGEPGVLPPSAVYACAAVLADCAFVDFTPSAGARLPALAELAARRAVPVSGSDGKTGETLLKAALAPMFASRALRVRAWSGTNLLGGGDGATLAGQAEAASKIASKSRVLEETLGYPPDGGVHIHNVPALGEWKTAWDHVAFEGFLGIRMTFQFTWQGCDSALAAPLVLDLARFAARAHAAGVGGPVAELAYFFKNPLDGAPHGLAAQYELLLRWSRARLGGTA